MNFITKLIFLEKLMSGMVSVNDLKPDIREVAPLGFGQQRVQDCAANTFAPSVGKNTGSE